MRKFLIVGCGGSGGATVRLLIDQLQADFRDNPALRDSALPAAWQFVHIDVPVSPDRGPEPLGSIRDLGGTYIPFGSVSANYAEVSRRVESQLSEHSFGPLVGWAPKDKKAANGVPIGLGAGQYRAIGRILTLPNLKSLHAALVAAQAKTAAPGSWGAVPRHLQTGGDEIIPIVIASMAGGSGASMFLDVCRLLGTVPGIDPASIGCLLYTADVFANLPEGARAGVDGNAMAAVSEVIAAVSRLGDSADHEMMEALGVPVRKDVPAFKRIVPIGRRVGGNGALFGDGTAEGVYRGVARAIAGLMTSAGATDRWVGFTIGNSNVLEGDQEQLGWRMNSEDLPFGSLGFASLSLGRDRYLDYAAQRLARASVDHLRAGHVNPASALPSQDQLRLLMDNQWGASLENMGLPGPGRAANEWFQSVAYPMDSFQATAREASTLAASTIRNTGAARASAWLATAQSAVGTAGPAVTAQLQRAAYAWAESWASTLEEAAKQEFVRVTAAFGLPYARELMIRVSQQCGPLIDELSSAGRAADTADPVAMDGSLAAQATALGKQVVDGVHALAQTMTASLNRACEARLRLEAARYAAAVLRSYVTDVLSALASTANESLTILDSEAAKSAAGAGLAQLHTATYSDWPDESDTVPARFDHAQNEVLLTTSAEFPQQFRADVTAAHQRSTYPEGLAAIRSEVIAGRWQTAGPVVTHAVLTQQGHWRAQVLNRSALDGQPTPQASPRYRLEMSAADVISRAQDRLSARGDVFERFAGQSITEYLKDPAVSDFERQDRQQGFAERFIETMAVARPLVGIDPGMVARLHKQPAKYEYNFSEIPFDDVDDANAIATLVRQRLAGDDSLVEGTDNVFKSALVGSSSPVKKISIFGSYAKVNPLCYSSLLDPIKSRWASADASYQRSLWLWKRARPVHAGLAMSSDEAVRVTAGWYLGRLLGLVRQANREAPEVRGVDGWLAFGPLLASRELAVQADTDMLASVLMGHSLALARCSSDTQLRPLAPYGALRRLIDTSGSTEKPPAIRDLAGTQLIAQALFGKPLTLKGAFPGGADAPLEGDGFAPVITDVRQADGPDIGGPQRDLGAPPPWVQPAAPALAGPRDGALPRARAEAIKAWLESLRGWYRSTGYVQPSGSTISFHKVEMLYEAPLSIEATPWAFMAFDLLDACVDAALTLDLDGERVISSGGGPVFV